MKKYMIVVFGPADTGKTTSIKNFERKLEKGRIFQNFSKTKLGWMSVDIRIKYESPNKSIKVGVFSSGDDCCRVNNTLNTYFMDCQIIICAARSCKSHINNIMKFADTNKYKLIPLLKLKATDRDNARMEKDIEAQVKTVFLHTIANASV